MEDARDLEKQTVLVKLMNQRELGFAGVPEEGPFFCKVVAVDSFGIWAENKNFITIEVKNSKGRYIPKSKQKPERHVVSVLLPWKDIQTVVMFAEDDVSTLAGEVLGEKAKNSGSIGFVS